MPPVDYAYDVVAGSSIGAMNAASMAVFPIGEEQQAVNTMEKRWLGKSVSEIISFWPYLGPLEMFWRTSVFNNKGIYEQMKSILDIGPF